MGWFSVTSTIRSGNGTNVPFAFQAEGIDTLDDFLAALVNGGAVIGTRYRVYNARGGELGRLSHPKRTILTAEGIASVTPFEDVEKFVLDA